MVAWFFRITLTSEQKDVLFSTSSWKLKKTVPSLFGQPIYLSLAALLSWDSLSLMRANLCQVTLLDLLCTVGEVCPTARDTCTHLHWGSCMNTRAGVTSQQLLDMQDVVAETPWVSSGHPCTHSRCSPGLTRGPKEKGRESLRHAHGAKCLCSTSWSEQ